MKSTCFHGGGATEKCHSVLTQAQPHYFKYPTLGRSVTTGEKTIFCEETLTSINILTIWIIFFWGGDAIKAV